MLRLAVPSDGALHDPSLLFLKSSGMGVSRRNLRRYTAEIPSLPGVAVHFQRGSDIAMKVEEGSAELGLVGLDRFLETRREGGGSRVVIENLGFGQAELALGVPDSWVDVSSLADLADLAVEFRAKGTDLRIATKFPRLVERFLLGHGVAFFTLVQSSGTLEAAPEMGYADIISDISSTGTTMRANRLKPIVGGSVLTSEACLIGNGTLLATDPEKLRLATAVVERIEGRMRSLDFYTITANMKGRDPDSLAAYVLKHADISGLRGPTISQVYTGDGNAWYSVTVIVEKHKLLGAVDQFRELGGSSVTVSQPDYVFHSECSAVERLTSPH
ncbi:MAG: ATP phosphoribosyltransferase [SAR202 cluster bacterium]|nr:ATP phosphoribosyltransferase [SAR202 cluster bacterium]